MVIFSAVTFKDVFKNVFSRLEASWITLSLSEAKHIVWGFFLHTHRQELGPFCSCVLSQNKKQV